MNYNLKKIIFSIVGEIVKISIVSNIYPIYKISFSLQLNWYWNSCFSLTFLKMFFPKLISLNNEMKLSPLKFKYWVGKFF